MRGWASRLGHKGLPRWEGGTATGEKSKPQIDDLRDSASLKTEMGACLGPGPEPLTLGGGLGVCLAGAVQCGGWGGHISELEFSLAFRYGVFRCSLIVS